jgi:CHRD domain
MRRALIGVVIVVVSLVAVFGASARPAASTKLEATLNGKAEGAPKTNKGKAEVTLNAATGKVCWDFRLAKIDGKPTQAHIHKGKAGVAGNVVVPFGASYKRQGCTSATKSLVKAILKSPGSYYVNVHNAKHPAGAMRGQLTRGA